MVALPEACPASTSSPRASEHPKFLHNRVVDLLRGGLTPKACRLLLQREKSHSQDQASRVVAKASTMLCGCDGRTSRARQLEIIAADLRAGSTSASCSASLVRDKGLSPSHAKRLVRNAAVRLGIASTPSKRSRAVADTIQQLLDGSSPNECRELLKQSHGFTPKQVKTILRRAVLGANQQQLYEEYRRAQEHDEANELCEKNQGFVPGKAVHFLNLV